MIALFLLGLAAIAGWGLLFVFAHIAEKRQGLCKRCHTLAATTGTEGLCLECFRKHRGNAAAERAKRDLNGEPVYYDKDRNAFIGKDFEVVNVLPPEAFNQAPEVNEEPALTRKRKNHEDPTATAHWPYCERCQQPFSFEPEEPFAYCGCGTCEWGSGRPALWVPDPSKETRMNWMGQPIKTDFGPQDLHAMPEDDRKRKLEYGMTPEDKKRYDAATSLEARCFVAMSVLARELIDRKEAFAPEAVLRAVFALKGWKDTLIDALVVNFILKEEHYTDPRKALGELIQWEMQLALDPVVSLEAQALVEKTRGLQRWTANDDQRHQDPNRFTPAERAIAEWDGVQC